MDEAVRAVLDGEVVGLPTDTVYGIGVTPASDSAMEKLFELKGRPEHKPIGLLAASLRQASEFGDLSGAAFRLAEDHWPGALTIIVRPKVVLAEWVGHRQTRTVGIRVPDHPDARDLLERAGPMAVTSANKSGGPETLSDTQARAVFGDEVAVYIPGVTPGGVASTVVDATGDGIEVIRQGPVAI